MICVALDGLFIFASFIYACRFHMDPSGTFVQCDARAIGSASEGAQSSLQEVYHKVKTHFIWPYSLLQLLDESREMKKISVTFIVAVSTNSIVWFSFKIAVNLISCSRITWVIFVSHQCILSNLKSVNYLWHFEYFFNIFYRLQVVLDLRSSQE